MDPCNVMTHGTWSSCPAVVEAYFLGGSGAPPFSCHFCISSEVHHHLWREIRAFKLWSSLSLSFLFFLSLSSLLFYCYHRCYCCLVKEMLLTSLSLIEKIREMNVWHIFLIIYLEGKSLKRLCPLQD